MAHASAHSSFTGLKGGGACRALPRAVTEHPFISAGTLAATSLSALALADARNKSSPPAIQLPHGAGYAHSQVLSRCPTLLKAYKATPFLTNGQGGSFAACCSKEMASPYGEFIRFGLNDATTAHCMCSGNHICCKDEAGSTRGLRPRVPPHA